MKRHAAGAARERAAGVDAARAPRRRRQRQGARASTGRRTPPTTAGVNAIKALGTANDFGVDEAAGVDRHQHRQARGLPRARLPQHGRRRARLRAGEAPSQRFVEDGNGFLGIGSTAPGEPGCVLQRPDRRAPAPGSPTDADARRSSSPATACTPRRATLPLLWTRTRRLVHVDTPRRPARAHRRALPRAERAPPATAPRPGGTDTPISWCRDYRGGRSFYTGMGRTAAAYAEADFKKHLLGALQWTAGLDPRRLQGDDQRQLQGHEDHERRRRGDRPRHQRRVARPRRPPTTAGSSTSAAATAAPTPSAARCSACRRSAASSTTPTRTSASAAARCTSSTRRPTTAPRTAASRAPASSPSTATAARAASAPTRTTTRWSTACSASRRRRTSPRRATSTCSTSRRFNPAIDAARPAGRAPRSRRCRARASRASRSTSQTKKLDLALRGPDLRVRRPDLLLLPRRRRHGLRLQGQPLRDDR